MSTDPEQRFREACAAIIEADTGMRTLCGRTAALLIARQAFALDTKVPIVVLMNLAFDQTAGRIEATFTGVADTGLRARELGERLSGILTAPAFQAQGLAVAPVGEPLRRDVFDERDSLQREGDPMLQESDAAFVFLYLD